MQSITDQKRERAIQDVKMYLANDWQLKGETPEYFLLTKNTASTGVHFLLFIFTFFTFGVINLIYHLMSKETKKVLK